MITINEMDIPNGIWTGGRSVLRGGGFVVWPLGKLIYEGGRLILLTLLALCSIDLLTERQF